MKKSEIHFTDLNRWLFGQTPPEFMIEVFIRTILIYIVLLFFVRLMGKRMAGQLTLTEMSVMITLGAIASPVMQLPDRAFLFGVLGLACACIYERGLNLWAFNNPRIERLTQGSLSMLVKDGNIQTEELSKTKVTRQQLFAFLREKEITNLSEVRRVYLEACGVMSIYTTDKHHAGIPVMPESDHGILDLQSHVDPATMACGNCGHIQNIETKEEPCKICGATEWQEAYIAEVQK